MKQIKKIRLPLKNFFLLLIQHINVKQNFYNFSKFF